MESASTYSPPPNGFRTFSIVWATQSISILGSALTFFSLNIWLVTTLYPKPEQKPQLAFALSAVALAFAIPTLAFAPLAGAWADRHDRKRTMIAMDFVSGLISLLLAILVINQVLQLWMLLAILSIAATAGAFHASAFDTSYVMLVPKEQLPRANGMMQTIWSLSGILSPAIAAAIIALPGLARQGSLPLGVNALLSPIKNGASLAMGVDAVTFFLAAVVPLPLFIPSPKRTDLKNNTGEPEKSIWSDIKAGGMYIWNRRPLLWLLGTFTVANFVGGPIGVFLPLLIRFNLAPDWQSLKLTLEAALAMLATSEGIGGLAGGLAISSWGGLKNKRVNGVLVPMIVSGIAMMWLGYSPWLYVSAFLLAIFAAMTPFMNAHSQAIWQTQTPPELQGRVFSVRRVIAQFSWPLSTALAGWLGGLFSPGAVITVLGAILAIFCTIQLFNPYLMGVENKEALDKMAAVAEAEK